MTPFISAISFFLSAAITLVVLKAISAPIVALLSPITALVFLWRVALDYAVLITVMLPSLFVALHLRWALYIWRAPYLWRAVCRYGGYVPYIPTAQSFAFPDPEPRYQIPFLRLKLIAIALRFLASISTVASI